MVAGSKAKSFIVTLMVGFAPPPPPSALCELLPLSERPKIATASAASAATNASQLSTDRSSLLMVASLLAGRGSQ